MKFILQEPAPILGGMVCYEHETSNLYTINESSTSESFYQNFGDVILNFDKLTGRFYSIDGRININNIDKPIGLSECDKSRSLKHSYLVTAHLGLEEISNSVEHYFDQRSNKLVVVNKAAANASRIEYAQILENVKVGLSEAAELVTVEISLLE